MLTQISQIPSLPDKCPIAQLQGKVSAVFEMKQVAGKPQQAFMLQDASGNSIRCSAWEHPDLSIYKDKDVVIMPGPKGGLSVNVYNGKHSVNISRTCTFQYTAVHHAQTGTPVPAPSAPAVADGKKPINGQTVGMAVKAAIDVHVATGTPITKKSIWKLASQIIRVSQYIEQGHLDPETAPSADKPTQEKNDSEEQPF